MFVTAVARRAGRARLRPPVARVPRAGGGLLRRAHATARYTSSVQQAVASGRDLWGGAPAPRARRPDLRRRAQVPARRSPGDAVGGAAADRERLVLPPAVVPVHARTARPSSRCTSRTAARSSRGASAAPSLSVFVGAGQRALRLVPGPPAAGAAGGGLPADPADLLHRRERASATGRSRSSVARTARTARAR